MHNEEYIRFATWHPAYAGSAVDHYFGDANDDADMNNRAAGSMIDVPYDQTWHRATVTNEPYRIRSLSSLWNAVKDIVTSRTQLIRDSRQGDRYYFVNDLYRLDYDTFEYYYRQHMFDLDIVGVEADMRRRIRKMRKDIMDMGQMLSGSDSETKINKDALEITGAEGMVETELSYIQQTDAPKIKPELELFESSIGDVSMSGIIINKKAEFTPNTQIEDTSLTPFEPGPEIWINEAPKFEIDMQIEDASIPEMEMTSIWINDAPEIKPALEIFESSIGDMALTEIQPSGAPHHMMSAPIDGKDVTPFEPGPEIIQTDAL